MKRGSALLACWFLCRSGLLVAEPPPPPPAFPLVAVPVPKQPGESANEVAAEESSPAPLSPRAELARLDCTTEDHRREVTLFGSGTIRLREGFLGAEAGGLFDLSKEELTGFLNRLGEEDLAEVVSPDRGPEGSWISRCVLTLQLPGRPRRELSYGQFDSLSLNLSRVVRIVEELGGKVPDLKQAGRLPDDFRARRGDVVRRDDGQLFRVVGFTSDGKGIELEGQDIPLALYLTPEQLRHDFVALVQRDR